MGEIQIRRHHLSGDETGGAFLYLARCALNDGVQFIMDVSFHFPKVWKLVSNYNRTPLYVFGNYIPIKLDAVLQMFGNLRLIIIGHQCTNEMDTGVHFKRMPVSK